MAPTLEEQQKLTDECIELPLSLPKEKGWRTLHLYQFQGFWCQSAEIQSIMSFQKHFQANDTDIVVASIPKSGTTWLKALAFAVSNRHCSFQTQRAILCSTQTLMILCLSLSTSSMPTTSSLISPTFLSQDSLEHTYPLLHWEIP
ncbi:hypothetical protein ACE6H2_006114 [Prunus campanulata]